MERSEIRIGRVFLCAVLLCVVALLLFAFQVNGVDAVKEKLTEMDRGNKGMDNIFWLVDEVAYLLPIIVTSVALMIVYKNQKGERELLHREQGYAVIAMMAFIYLLFLPIIASISPKGEDEISLMQASAQWFVREGIFFVVLALYHFARAEATDGDEDEEPEEIEEFEDED